MADAKLLKTKIIAETKDAKIPAVCCQRLTRIFDGWLKADPAARGEDVELPKVTKGEALDVERMSRWRRSRHPTNRYTEAGLIKELEKRGIGRPSTYASS
jgi:DNA topoisomerase-1